MKIKVFFIFGAKQVSGQIQHKDTDNNQNEENESPHCEDVLNISISIKSEQFKLHKNHYAFFWIFKSHKSTRWGSHPKIDDFF